MSVLIVGPRLLAALALGCAGAWAQGPSKSVPVTVDNFIRPYLISQGAKLPLLLIVVGVIGGLLAYGFIGLFIGATLLGVGYTLLLSWLDETPAPPGASFRD